MECLVTRKELEDVVGSQPLGSMLKSIEEFDHHCVDMLALARAAVLGTVGPDGSVQSTLVGGDAGFACAPTPERVELAVPTDLAAGDGAPAALVFLIPGLGETLRVNGRLRLGDRAGVEAEEIYVHCAKAIIRSHLWDGAPTTPAPDPVAVPDGSGPLADAEVRDVVARAPFAVIASHDGRGAADTSPKGDPAGFVRVLDASTLAIPDRPGNRRTDTWHNIVEQPDVGLLLITPGDDRVLEVRGTGRLTTDDAVREPMAVNGKVPKVALVVDVAHAEVTTSKVPAAAALWDPSRNIDRTVLPRMSQVWTDHVKANRTGGAAAAAARKLANAKLLEKGLEHDYRKNLY